MKNKHAHLKKDLKSKNNFLTFSLASPLAIAVIVFVVIGSVSAVVASKALFNQVDNLVQNQNETDDREAINTTTSSTPTEPSPTINEPSQQQSTTSSDVAKPVCTTKEIPFEIEYKDADWLDKGETYTSPGDTGRNGVVIVCMNAAGQIVSEKQTASVINKTVHVGTRAVEVPITPSPQYTFDQALSLASQTCRSLGYYPDSTDMTDCKNKEMKKYGY